MSLSPGPSSPLHAKHLRGLALDSSLSCLIFQKHRLVALDIQTQQLILEAPIPIPRPRHVHIHHASPTRPLDIEMHAKMCGAELIHLVAIRQRPRPRPLIRRRLPVRLDLPRRAQ